MRRTSSERRQQQQQQHRKTVSSSSNATSVGAGASNSTPSWYTPYIFSFIAEDGTAFEAYLTPIPSSSPSSAGGGQQQQYSLQLEHRRNKATPQRVQWSSSSSSSLLLAEGPKVTEGRWTFLALSHRASAGFRGNAGEVLLMINGSFYRGSLPFPQLKTSTNKSGIGCRPIEDVLSLRGSSTSTHTCLKG